MGEYFMKNKLSCFCILFSLGGTAYGLLEIIWRRHTHWSMILTGGLCFAALYKIFRSIGICTMRLKCLIGCTVITITELLSGFVLNYCFKLCVWDYSSHRFNFCGQICPFYSMLWAFLTIPVTHICSFIDRKFHLV